MTAQRHLPLQVGAEMGAGFPQWFEAGKVALDSKVGAFPGIPAMSYGAPSVHACVNGCSRGANTWANIYMKYQKQHSLNQNSTKRAVLEALKKLDMGWTHHS